jgi:Rrf2 family iron-sulfur cluster assembly transcriptional regulator
MQFSVSIEYAIHGLIYLARTGEEKSVLLADIAAAIKVPKEYMRKIFQMLTRSGLVAGRRGAGGGYRLARPAEELTLRDVVEAVEGSLPLYGCLHMRRHCELALTCPVQKAFDAAREKMAEVLQDTTIRDLTREIAENRREHSWLKVTA